MPFYCALTSLSDSFILFSGCLATKSVDSDHVVLIHSCSSLLHWFTKFVHPFVRSTIAIQFFSGTSYYSHIDPLFHSSFDRSRVLWFIHQFIHSFILSFINLFIYFFWLNRLMPEWAVLFVTITHYLILQIEYSESRGMFVIFDLVLHDW